MVLHRACGGMAVPTQTHQEAQNCRETGTTRACGGTAVPL